MGVQKVQCAKVEAVQLKGNQVEGQKIEAVQEKIEGPVFSPMDDQKYNLSPYNKLMGHPSQQKSLYEGKLYRLQQGKWQIVTNAVLTPENFLNIKIINMTKIKIKAESQVNGTRMIKISTNTEDFFFSVYVQEQRELMAALIWAKLASMGRTCPFNDPFSNKI